LAATFATVRVPPIPTDTDSSVRASTSARRSPATSSHGRTTPARVHALAAVTSRNASSSDTGVTRGA
jgi:hypothetical protein